MSFDTQVRNLIYDKVCIGFLKCEEGSSETLNVKRNDSLKHLTSRYEIPNGQEVGSENLKMRLQIISKYVDNQHKTLR